MTAPEPRVHEFTPDQIEAGISSALREHNVAVVPGLIKLLALQDPHRAQDVLDTIEMARIVRSAEARRG